MENRKEELEKELKILEKKSQTVSILVESYIGERFINCFGADLFAWEWIEEENCFELILDGNTISAKESEIFVDLEWCEIKIVYGA